VATAAREVVILVDDSKLVGRLGTKAPLPVEVVPFGWKCHLAFIVSLGGTPTLRLEPDGKPFVTDEGNYILHCRFEGGIADPAELEAKLLGRAGVVGTGLFLGVAHRVIVGTPDGVEVLTRKG
jgi:ribose 5-phosphate isomerase A